MVTATMNDGRPIFWDVSLGVWRHEDGNQALPDCQICAHCGQSPAPVPVVIPADLSCTNADRVAVKLIDACIADLVRRLNAGATEPVTTGSCCGHGKRPGEIWLADGRVLEVKAVP